MEAANKPCALIDFSTKETISQPSMQESFGVCVCAYTGVGFSAGRVMGLMYAIIGVIEGQCWTLNEALGSGDKVPSHE